MISQTASSDRLSHLSTSTVPDQERTTYQPDALTSTPRGSMIVLFTSINHFSAHGFTVLEGFTLMFVQRPFPFIPETEQQRVPSGLPLLGATVTSPTATDNVRFRRTVQRTESRDAAPSTRASLSVGSHFASSFGNAVRSTCRRVDIEQSSCATDQMSELLVTPLDYHGIMP